MNLLVLDFETFFDSDYTLRKLTTEAYIRDPRFETLGVGLIESWRGTKGWWVEGPQVRQVLSAYDWSNTAVLAHHSQFDGLILSHHYGIKPRFFYDTLSMARLVLGVHLPVGLDALAKHFGLAAKTVPYHEFKGMRFSELARNPGLLSRLSDGCLHDCVLTLSIFQKFMSGDY